MALFGIIAVSCLVTLLGQVHSISFCNKNSECSDSECCFRGLIVPININSELKHGQCSMYINEGKSCADILTCGCKPGLTCQEGICNKSSTPYVAPDSLLPCNQDSECESKSECCAKNMVGYNILDIFGTGKSGKCRRYRKTEGDVCVKNPIADCGCSPGLECLLETPGTDELTDPTTCQKKS